MVSRLFALVYTAQLFWTAYSKSPSEEDWKNLNNTVGGRLLVGVPFAQPCFNSWNSSECLSIQDNYLQECDPYSFSGQTDTDISFSYFQWLGQVPHLRTSKPSGKHVKHQGNSVFWIISILTTLSPLCLPRSVSSEASRITLWVSVSTITSPASSSRILDWCQGRARCHRWIGVHQEDTNSICHQEHRSWCQVYLP